MQFISCGVAARGLQDALIWLSGLAPPDISNRSFVIFGKCWWGYCGDVKILLIKSNSLRVTARNSIFRLGPGIACRRECSCSFYLNPTMSKSEPIDFSCPGCEAEYKVVTIDAPSDAVHGTIVCLKCDALFPAGKGRDFFKYFLVGRSSGRHNRRK